MKSQNRIYCSLVVTPVFLFIFAFTFTLFAGRALATRLSPPEKKVAAQTPPKAWLGISFQDLPGSEVPSEYGAVSQVGVVRVLQVFKNTSADQAGIQVDDILLAINNAPMQGRTTLLDSVQIRKVGETVVLKIGRAGKVIHQKMALSPKPEDLTAITRTLIGSPAPALEGQYYHGSAGRLAELKGKVVLLDFWATWCGPCRHTLPELNAVYQSFKDQGLVVIGVSSETKAELEAFQAQSPVSYPLFQDIAQLSTRKYQAFAYPTLVLIDKQGIVQRIEVGAHNRETLSAWVKELL